MLTFLCLELCGPPKVIEKPNPHDLADAIVRITANESLVKQLVQVLEKRDHNAFQRIVAEHKLGLLCHFFCHWLCVIRYRLLCRWVCSPERIEKPDLAGELKAAGLALRQLLEHKQAFDQAVAASDAGDSAKLGSAIQAADLLSRCRFICEWFCSWRCTLVCLNLCRQYPVRESTNHIEEALAFAKALQPLLQNLTQFERLSVAVGSGDTKAYDAILKEFKLPHFCIQLCHWVCGLRCRRFCNLACPPQQLYPWFTSIGRYDYLTDIHSPHGLGVDGLTNDGRAFYSNLRLNGILSQTLGGQQLEYRFETRPTDNDGNPTGPWSPVLPAQIARTEIGHWERFKPVFPFIETKKYTVNGTAGPNEKVATIAADGWIQVPQENNYMSPAGAFFSNGNMIELISRSLAPFTPADETGVKAGSQATHPLVQDVYFGIRMRIRQVGNAASETDGGTCEHIAIDNTLYNSITLHPSWDGGLQSPGQLAVRMLDIDELIAHPCGDIQDTLTVKFTAAHPNLGSVSISMTGPGGPYPFTLTPIPEPGDWFGAANPPAPPDPNAWSVSGLAPCAYLVTLTITVLLTDGDNVPDALYDQIAFCKK